MSIEKLKSLEASAEELYAAPFTLTVPNESPMTMATSDGFRVASGPLSAHATFRLLVAFRNLAPQIIAVLEAAEGVEVTHYDFQGLHALDSALSAFRAAAKEVLP